MEQPKHYCDFCGVELGQSPDDQPWYYQSSAGQYVLCSYLCLLRLVSWIRRRGK